MEGSWYRRGREMRRDIVDYGNSVVRSVSLPRTPGYHRRSPSIHLRNLERRDFYDRNTEHRYEDRESYRVGRRAIFILHQLEIGLSDAEDITKQLNRRDDSEERASPPNLQ